MSTATFVTHLICFRCDRQYPASETANVCPACGSKHNGADPAATLAGLGDLSELLQHEIDHLDGIKRDRA